MSLLDSIGRFFAPGPTAEEARQLAAARLRSEQWQADCMLALTEKRVPDAIKTRLLGARDGKLPWTATLTPAELLVVRSHGVKPVAAVSASCWLHYGYSWTNGHHQGWNAALDRLKAEARIAGANAVLDVKMRTIPLDVEDSMDYTLVGTAVQVDSLPKSPSVHVATVPALEFVKLLDADVVPTGIAIGAHYEWLENWRAMSRVMYGNAEDPALSQHLARVRRAAYAQLRTDATRMGNGVLAHINFSQLLESEVNERKRYLARHIVIATTVRTSGRAIPHDFTMAVDMRDGGSPLTGTRPHHQSYATNEEEGAV